ncbi:YfcC family protein [Endozoicomonadaceae bacterium StTr2]
MKFPSAYTILMLLIVFVALLTWVVPAGVYQTQLSEELGRDTPIPGTYEEVEPTPQGIEEIVLAPISGFFDPDSYEARAIDVALFVLFIGGFLGVVTKTGAIDAGINQATAALEGREKWLIPILMFLFSLGGTIYGMAEETLAFYPLMIPVIIGAGYDAMTAVAIIMLGAGIGTLGSTVNPFATVIASDAAGVPFTDGIDMRLMIYIVGLLICVGYVMRYAEKVHRNPALSLVAEQKEDNEKHFLQGRDEGSMPELTGARKLILVVFLLAFVIMVYGVSVRGWWMAEMSALFLVASIVTGLLGKMSEEELTSNFVDGARDLLGVALVVGLARGIVVIMDNGQITNTILYWSEQALNDVSSVMFINLMFIIQLILSFFVPSSSGLAVLTMPIMAPLADFSGVARDLVVTAYQSASGLLNLVTPTSAVIMGGLAIGRISFDRWVVFVWPLLLVLFVLLLICFSVAALF